MAPKYSKNWSPALEKKNENILQSIDFILQEAEIAKLQTAINSIKEDGGHLKNEVTPELDKLRTENAKLKYRIKHLKRVCPAFPNIACSLYILLSSSNINPLFL